MSTRWAALLLWAVTAASSNPNASFSFDSTGGYTVLVDGEEWYSSSGPPTVCIAGAQEQMQLTGKFGTSGTDKFGKWEGETARYGTPQHGEEVMTVTLKRYPSHPQLVVGTAAFRVSVNTSKCGNNTQLSTRFPEFSTTAAQATSLHTLSWRGGVIDTTAAAKGLGNLGANGLDCGPVVSTDPTSPKHATLVWSTLDSHKIIPQQTQGTSYAMGIAAAIPELPSGFNYSVIFSAAYGGATAAMYAWGDLIRGYHSTTRMPSVTLTDIGYYTDDGAYYYVWGGGKELHDPQLSTWIPARPWAAEEGLVLVKEALYAMGVPIAYMQLDDWWYQGPFYFGNVKAVQDWNASSSPGLFPSGLPAFSDRLALPLQLYTPFWDDKYQTKYRMSESTKFKGTKLVVPDDSYPFFSDLFDLGKAMTNGRFTTYEIDFLDANFQGCQACFTDVGAADRWYRGMADAAKERNITIQYCLPSATDMLLSLAYPAVVQARASGDYARPEGDKSPWGNVVTLGGASLLLGATHVAPSKDTLWTRSPQPPTSSDRTHVGYHTQPHVALDAILATLSLGPVGISDGLNQTDPELIGQAFMSSKDSTLLRPSRPLSTVDAVFTNKSLGVRVSDIRGTHAALRPGTPNTHYVLAWMTTEAVTLQATDLFPPPPPSAKLAVRKHVVAPASSQLDGCEDGKAAVPSCITILPPGRKPVIDPVGGSITDYSLTVVYEPLSNGAYFLGELSKFVHVSPQRFTSVEAEGSGPCGVTVTVKGTAGERVLLVGVDTSGIVHRTTVTIPAVGTAVAQL